MMTKKMKFDMLGKSKIPLYMKQRIGHNWFKWMGRMRKPWWTYDKNMKYIKARSFKDREYPHVRRMMEGNQE